ncbi:hypothetical protein KI387_020283, partial [Taxus chinensis]
ETLGAELQISSILESLFKGWMFFASDARGRSGGLAIGWNPQKIRLVSSWGFESGLGLDFFSEEMDMEMLALNIYGPYGDRVDF